MCMVKNKIKIERERTAAAAAVAVVWLVIRHNGDALEV